MQLEIFDSGLEKEDVAGLPHRLACRGIIQKDGKYLIVRTKKYDIHMFPGGGIEDNESEREACIREVLEETGVRVDVVEETVRITEYFSDSIWTNVYFICDYIEQSKEPNLTDEEVELGLETIWLTLEELMDTLENNMTTHPHGPNVHNREFLGLINSIGK